MVEVIDQESGVRTGLAYFIHYRTDYFFYFYMIHTLDDYFISSDAPFGFALLEFHLNTTRRSGKLLR